MLFTWGDNRRGQLGRDSGGGVGDRSVGHVNVPSGAASAFGAPTPERSQSGAATTQAAGASAEARPLGRGARAVALPSVADAKEDNGGGGKSQQHQARKAPRFFCPIHVERQKNDGAKMPRMV
jgi:hypothetical protein